ncbi:hypothetical protein Cgig2_030688 [Carnegiea gigantea]|uniref:Uncharacterized protein n=1 Tax=Carnegiea gigantea TaxID=171969 RepID=A0A9Q1GPV2_9CARY|nr:hypothetical protein Cgig2_030688 [Carnegiea gigantea]
MKEDTLNEFARATKPMHEKRVLPKENIPALLDFGDSIVDPGNNNEIMLTFIKANFPPYGKDFEDEKATADAPGVKKLLLAYLDPDLQDEELLTGVSFASSACGFDPLTSRIIISGNNVKLMKDQLNMFKAYTTKVKAMVAEEQTNFILGNSVYVVVAGTDDLANTYFSTPFIRDDYDVHSYTDLVRNSASSFIEVHHSIKDRFSIILFNNKLAVELKALGHRLPDSEIVYMDIYSIFLDLIENGINYGFEVVDKGCCGSGAIEVAVFCNLFSTTCDDRTNYHPSERADKIIVDQIVEKYMKHFV